MTFDILPAGVEGYGKGKRLQKLAKALRPALGHGRGMRRKSKPVPKQWLIGQLYRTCERIALEPLLRQQREALRLALNLLHAL